MVKKIIKSGNSLAVTVPADFVHDLGLKAGGEVNVVIDRDKNRLIYSFTGTTQLSLSPNIQKKAVKSR